MLTEVATGRAVTARQLDHLERGVVLAIYGYSLWIVVPPVMAHPSFGGVLLMAGELLVVVFTVIRRTPEVISVHPLDWALGVAGTSLSLLAVPPYGPALVPVWVAALIVLAGLVLSIWGKLALGRSFSVVPALGRVARHGPYRLVRHPIYAGYLLTQAGLLLDGVNVRNLAVYLPTWVLFWLRTGREERLLLTDPGYAGYAQQVRHRLIPGVL